MQTEKRIIITQDTCGMTLSQENTGILGISSRDSHGMASSRKHSGIRDITTRVSHG
jgi:hypothetical protein